MNLIKSLSTVFALILSVGLISSTLPVKTTPVNADASKIVWTANKVTGSHTGTINLKEGAFDFEDGALVGGSFTIDMTTINTTDLEGEWKGKLDGHLKSPDFFDVENHPTATFAIKKVSAKGTPGDYKVTGDVTIKGITKEVKFYTNVKETSGEYLATATITLDRTDFDVRYGSGSFFDNLGDKTIYDEFELAVSLSTKK